MELVIAEIRALPFIIEGSSKGEVETPAEKDNLLDKIQIIRRSFDQGQKRSPLTLFWLSSLTKLGASLKAQLVKNPPAMQESPVQFLGQEDPLEKEYTITPVFLGFPCGSAGKESTSNAGDLGLILGLGRSPGEGNGYPLQYSGLENSIICIVHGVAKSRTWLQFSLQFINQTDWVPAIFFFGTYETVQHNIS